MSKPTKMTFIRDRTISIQFDLRRNISGDTLYFAMKSDRKSDYYDIEPIECTVVNATAGQFEVTITNDMTVNLPTGLYYGELMRVTSSSAIQTLMMYEIDLRPEIISSRDVS